VPEIVIDVPIEPELGDTLVMEGAGTTVSFTPLLLVPPTVTTTFPVVAPIGTSAWIEVAVHDEKMVTGLLLTVTVLVP
jgi:hypothetical protein